MPTKVKRVAFHPHVSDFYRWLATSYGIPYTNLMEAILCQVAYQAWPKTVDQFIEARECGQGTSVASPLDAWSTTTWPGYPKLEIKYNGQEPPTIRRDRVGKGDTP